MSWTTVYISGTTDFRDDVRRKLAHSDQRTMPGYIENYPGEATHDLYWIDDRSTLKSFKEAIGAKLIWKHRLRFYESLEAFHAAMPGTTTSEFSQREREMIEEMRGAA
ncbi:MAG: hypothetical protein U0289_14355 [Cyclobacteriaceae bacterium]|jgi:hypothetical protein|nr:hypothetical protein [Cytophagales bacterium]HNP76584.1 hypothetical protein [Cyclobacteriaceae bacterium]